MNQDKRFSDDFIAEWANVLAVVRSGAIDRDLAIYLLGRRIYNEEDAERKLFFKNAAADQADEVPAMKISISYIPSEVYIISI